MHFSSVKVPNFHKMYCKNYGLVLQYKSYIFYFRKIIFYICFFYLDSIPLFKNCLTPETKGGATVDNTLGIITEIIVLIFNILIYMQVTVPKKNDFKTKLIMYIGSTVILSVFFVCTYFLRFPEALASFIFVTLPSFILFFALSKFKDFRFFVTFCFLDTTTLIITFFSRFADIKFGHICGSVTSLIVVAFMLVLYIKGKPFFKIYRDLLKNVKNGWSSMSLATLMIYFLLVFSASYPVPLIKRPEYLVPYMALSLTILTVYAVFIISLIQKKQLCDLNERLINEKKWHKIAYTDALTGLKNRTAYVENINNLERKLPKDSHVSIIMIDIDDFKNVNDTMGHQAGDELLKNVASALQKIFFDVGFVVYRVGGDEFVVIALEVVPEYLKPIIDNINQAKELTELGCSVSIGHSDVNLLENNAFERAFARADEKMYNQKISKKQLS